MSEAESDGVKATRVREARQKLPPSIDVNPWLTSASPSLFLKLEISGRLSKHRLKIGFRSASKHSTYCRVLTEIWRYKHDFVFLCNSPIPHAIYSESYFQTFFFAKVQLQRRADTSFCENPFSRFNADTASKVQRGFSDLVPLLGPSNQTNPRFLTCSYSAPRSALSI